MRWESRAYGTRAEIVAALKARGTTPGSSERRLAETAKAAAAIEDEDGADEVLCCGILWVVEDHPDEAVTDREQAATVPDTP